MKDVTVKESSCTNFCMRSASGMNKQGQTGTTIWRYSGKTSKRVRDVSLVKSSQLVYLLWTLLAGNLSIFPNAA